ncbi:MAG TPA: phosphodiester glycosidase family protein [Aggregatilineaceae bacterium]|nr:phosphodiester glycosidase family protein [Anaerolineae bacterium]HMM26834.1 phosphodiester glycosidase family protein [Aggregatilineaceae bacterium]
MPLRFRPVLLWTIWGALSGLLLLAPGCTLTRATIPPPTPTPTSAPTPVSGDGWETVRPGIEQRTARVPGQGPFGAQAMIVRVDPALATFQVAYRPGDPLSLSEWRAALPGAAVIVNGGFFDEFSRALGLVVSEGQAYGQSFSGFGGMFQVTEAGPRVRSLVSEPYLGEPLWHAVQSFPMLIEAGGVLAPRGDGFDVPARRTIIAQDGAGRILLIVTPLSEVSFSAAQDWLLSADLDVRIALALDGGRSTGLALDHVEGPDDLYPAFDRLPSVIAVFPR